MNLKFVTHKMLNPTEPTIKEEENNLFCFPHMVDALDNFHKLHICTEPKPFKSCLRTVLLTQNLKDTF